MARWKPDARGRLEEAALELYSKRGFDQATVAEIAARAGLTERTFYRHFTDKREVLFWGEGDLRDLLVRGVDNAPESASPIDAFAAGLKSAVATYFAHRPRALARQRHGVIEAHAGLQERELIKLAALASAAADSLRRRGVADPAASLTAEVGVAVFKIASARWVGDVRDRGICHHVAEMLDELRALTAED